MTLEFCDYVSPATELLLTLSARAPHNPFYTTEYTEARKRLGWDVVAFTLESYGEIETGCTAFTRHGRLNRRLEIHSLPAMPDSNTFWEGVLRFARRQRFTVLSVNTAASPFCAIPQLAREISRRRRCEYVLDLKNEDLLTLTSEGHRRKIKRASKETLMEVRIACGDDDAACERHLRLVNSSMLRRQQRGENVSLEENSDYCRRMVASGAGKIFEAVLDGEALSSLLILFAPQGAYYASAGTCDEGMKLGASPLLVYSIAKHLQERNLQIFNLGGTSLDDEGSGLRQFKSGFGAKAVNLESAEFYLGGALRKKITTILAGSSTR